MRIVYLCADRGIPLNGHKGASVHVRAVAEVLSRRGHDVNVVAVRDAESNPELPAAIVSPRFDRVLKDLKKKLQDGAGTTLASEVQGLLLNSLCLEALEETHRVAPVDAVYERYSLWSTAGMQFASRHGIPFVLEVNAPLIAEQREYRALSLAPVAEAVEICLFSGADAIFVPSRELKAYVQSKAEGEGRVVVVPNGADLSRFGAGRKASTARELCAATPGLAALESASARHEDKFVVAFVGSLKPWHGVELLLASFERLLAGVPDAHLVVVGDGPLMPQVREVASRLGDEAVTVTGSVPHEEVPGWLALATVGVAPYPPLDDFYFSPLKVVEYMAAGLPVIASNIGQLSELVVSGQTGLLVPPGDVAALTGALSRLAANAPLARRMGRRGRRRAERRHGWDPVAGKIEQELEQLRAKYARRERPAAKPAVATVAGAMDDATATAGAKAAVATAGPAVMEMAR